MSLDWQADVTEAHRLLRPEHIGTTPSVLDDATLDLRTRLIDEEADELRVALVNDDLPGAADAMGDLIYVIVGTAIAMGIDLRPVWDAIQASNLAKAGGGRQANGKWAKPPGWVAPDIAAILANQGPLTR